MKNLIIEKPSLVPLSNRVGWTFFTTIFWIVWFYLWLPLITLFLWLLGFKLFDEYFLAPYLKELDTVQPLFIIYGLVILCLGSALMIWAATEFMRFRNVHRRVRPLPVAVDELAEYAQVPANKMAELSSARRMVAHHDAHGKFLYADIG